MEETTQWRSWQTRGVKASAAWSVAERHATEAFPLTQEDPQ